MTQNTNPQRPTSTLKLWMLGIVGGIIVAFFAEGEDAASTRENATQIGAWAVRALLVGVIFLGGWGALRRKRHAPTEQPHQGR